jgi:hypothetical protein
MLNWKSLVDIENIYITRNLLHYITRSPNVLLCYRLTHCAREYMVETVLPRLLDMAVSIDLYSSHGATLSIGQVVLALALTDQKSGGAAEVLTRSGLFQRVEELVDRFIAGTVQTAPPLLCHPWTN